MSRPGSGEVPSGRHCSSPGVSVLTCSSCPTHMIFQKAFDSALVTQVVRGLSPGPKSGWGWREPSPCLPGAAMVTVRGAQHITLLPSKDSGALRPPPAPAPVSSKGLWFSQAGVSTSLGLVLSVLFTWVPGASSPWPWGPGSLEQGLLGAQGGSGAPGWIPPLRLLPPPRPACPALIDSSNDHPPLPTPFFWRRTEKDSVCMPLCSLCLSPSLFPRLVFVYLSVALGVSLSVTLCGGHRRVLIIYSLGFCPFFFFSARGSPLSVPLWSLCLSVSLVSTSPLLPTWHAVAGEGGAGSTLSEPLLP